MGASMLANWRRAAVAVAVALLGSVVAGCGAGPTPSPDVTSAWASGVPWASAGLSPKVVCDDNAPQGWHADASGSQVPDAITMTCEHAVAAAEDVVPPAPMTAFIEFSFGKWCAEQGAPCGPAPPVNTGYVLFRNCVGRLCRADDLVVVVSADAAGRVSAEQPQVAPKPSG